LQKRASVSLEVEQREQVRCAFGDAQLDSLYATSGDGCVYRAQSTGRRGFKRW